MLINNLISKINFGIKRRVRFIYVDVNNLILDILHILYKQGVIRSYIIKNNKIIIYLKYNLSRPIMKLTLISKPGNKIYWTLGKLAKKYNYHNFSGFYIISTQKGLYSSDYCLLQGNLSGEILIKVEI